MAKQPLLLMILDGWGIAPAGQYNAAALAKTPNLDALFDKYPHTRLSCSGAAVGLPDGQMGNSEVGHLNIGAGRIVYQELTRICLLYTSRKSGWNLVVCIYCFDCCGKGKIFFCCSKIFVRYG